MVLEENIAGCVTQQSPSELQGWHLMTYFFSQPLLDSRAFHFNLIYFYQSQLTCFPAVRKRIVYFHKERFINGGKGKQAQVICMCFNNLCSQCISKCLESLQWFVKSSNLISHLSNYSSVYYTHSILHYTNQTYTAINWFSQMQDVLHIDQITQCKPRFWQNMDSFEFEI